MDNSLHVRVTVPVSLKSDILRSVVCQVNSADGLAHMLYLLRNKIGHFL